VIHSPAGNVQRDAEPPHHVLSSATADSTPTSLGARDEVHARR
jgi:hypothetical protein